MATKTWAIILVIICTFFTAFAQLLWKFGTKTLVFTDITTIIFNAPLVIGSFIYLFTAFLLVVAYKGGEINVLYPFIALGFVWVIILSAIFLNEPINLTKIFGITSIFAGVSFIGYGGKKSGY